jgi:hypothetical protein
VRIPGRSFFVGNAFCSKFGGKNAFRDFPAVEDFGSVILLQCTIIWIPSTSSETSDKCRPGRQLEHHGKATRTDRRGRSGCLVNICQCWRGGSIQGRNIEEERGRPTIWKIEARRISLLDDRCGRGRSRRGRGSVLRNRQERRMDWKDSIDISSRMVHEAQPQASKVSYNSVTQKYFAWRAARAM